MGQTHSCSRVVALDFDQPVQGVTKIEALFVPLTVGLNGRATMVNHSPACHVDRKLLSPVVRYFSLELTGSLDPVLPLNGQR